MENDSYSIKAADIIGSFFFFSLIIVIIIEEGHTPALYLNNNAIKFASNIEAEFDIDLYANPYKDKLE